jgi:hypothetical protein
VEMPSLLPVTVCSPVVFIGLAVLDTSLAGRGGVFDTCSLKIGQDVKPLDCQRDGIKPVRQSGRPDGLRHTHRCENGPAAEDIETFAWGLNLFDQSIHLCDAGAFYLGSVWIFLVGLDHGNRAAYGV